MLGRGVGLEQSVVVRASKHLSGAKSGGQASEESWRRRWGGLEAAPLDSQSASLAVRCTGGLVAVW